MDITRHGILIEATCVDCTVEVVLNGIPLGLAGLGPQSDFQRPVHEYLVDGANEIGLVIQPGDSPSRWREAATKSKAAWNAQPPDTPLTRAFAGGAPAAAPGPGGSPPVEPPADRDPEWGVEHVVWDVTGLAALPTMRASARLARYPVGAVAGREPADTLLEVNWSAYDEFRTLRQAEQPFPKWVASTGDLGPLFGSPHWNQFRELSLDEPTVESLRAFVLEVRDEIEAGQPEPVLQRSRVKFEEVGHAYGIDPAERADIFRKLLSENAGDEDWLFQTPEPEDWSFRLCAANRLVECIASDWTPLVKGIRVPDKGRFLFPMLIGAIDSGWIIAR